MDNEKKEDTTSNTFSNSKQEQIHDILFNREIGWQEIIHDLINTEQLDPWDIDIIVLTDRYLDKIKEMEEADFFVSGKVLLAASLLLRIKSEILLNKYIKSVDEILFGDKDNDQLRTDLETGKVFEIFDKDEIPELIPKSPMPRFRRVTLQEIMDSLNKAIATENRRIKRKISEKDRIRQTSFSLPKRKFSIKNKIKELYGKLLKQLKEDEKRKKISFTEFVGTDKEERIISFSSLLHLDHQKKVWLEQENHFEEFYIWLKEVFFRHNPDPFLELREEVEKKTEELDNEKKKRIEKINRDFENPLGSLFD